MELILVEQSIDAGLVCLRQHQNALLIWALKRSRPVGPKTG